ncbi:ferrochelatase [Alysiella crassa]|uniref:Ferrochelatase n=1 Tax=Alysiella crassa TaxID=153491 RepID=A0A376BVW5_9NEIS|nr:ferrochelatase [Alysiella crassa]UOP08265.1 ferrochelatase [Alysiella crassa]SSY80943.1 Ferrochelatase [Alysiella crassa]
MSLLNQFNIEPEISFEQQNKIGVLLLNLGTPTQAKPEAVKPFLRKFLSDQRVVELPKAIWYPILHGIVLPLRPKVVAENYERVWLKEGSPLQVFTEKQTAGLRERLPDTVFIEYAMTYGEPSVPQMVAKLKAAGVGRLLVVPLYPQYAASCTAAAVDKVLAELAKQRNQMSVRTVSRFFNHEGYVNALANQIRNYRAQHGAGDKLMFSFHGIPLRQHKLGDPYPHECHATAKLVAEKLGLSQNDYIVSFQSQFGKDKWIEPSTQALFKSLPKQGVKKLDVICPGFVSDCLETMEEIAIAGREEFHEAGGEAYNYIPCLNANAEWLDALTDLVKENLLGWLKYDLVDLK